MQMGDIHINVYFIVGHSDDVCSSMSEGYLWSGYLLQNLHLHPGNTDDQRGQRLQNTNIN